MSYVKYFFFKCITIFLKCSHLNFFQKLQFWKIITSSIPFKCSINHDDDFYLYVAKWLQVEEWKNATDVQESPRVRKKKIKKNWTILRMKRYRYVTRTHCYEWKREAYVIRADKTRNFGKYNQCKAWGVYLVGTYAFTLGYRKRVCKDARGWWSKPKVDTDCI